MKATAKAPANIAFIKYWGRNDPIRRIPYNPSISMNLSSCITTTTVEFSKDFEKDSVSEGFNEKRILEHLDRIRALATTDVRARVETENSFPKSAGIASSASGFAALTVAATGAVGLNLSQQELTALARVGSGSACRSIPDGFVKWEGEHAYSLYPPDWWDLRDILVIVEHGPKNVSSSKGHDAVLTSPFFQKRLAVLPNRIARCEEALKKKNLKLLGEVIEEDCMDMHHVMQTQDRPLFYWNEKTDEVIKTAKKSGTPVYFTVDAGPNVHLICEATDEEKIKKLFGAYTVIVNKPARGAHTI